jgi:hypothetical protein
VYSLVCYTSIKQNWICAEIIWLKSRNQRWASVNLVPYSAGKFLG